MGNAARTEPSTGWIDRLRRRPTTAPFSLRLTIYTLALFVLAWTSLSVLKDSLNPATSPHHRQQIVSNPGYQHAQRLRVATARAAMDALGMSGTDSASYQLDYRVQRMQMQADSQGLDRWATRDLQRQGLLLEIRASLGAFRVALDQKTGSAAVSASATAIPLLPALDRAQRALSNYSASLSEPSIPTDVAQYKGWPSIVLLLVEFALVLWLTIWLYRPEQC